MEENNNILRAKHHFFIYPFFQRYTKYKIRKGFLSVSIEGEFTDKNKAIMLIGNHISWWDGFWAMYINLRLFKRRFHFMMREDQLLKHHFFNLTGGFSISSRPRNIIESINYSSTILDNKENILLIYPQGEINSIYQSNFQFKRGIEKIIKDKDIQLVFSANLIDYFSHPKPSLFIYIQDYKGDFTHKSIEEEYNKFYAKSLQYQIHRQND